MVISIDFGSCYIAGVPSKALCHQTKMPQLLCTKPMEITEANIAWHLFQYLISI